VSYAEINTESFVKTPNHSICRQFMLQTAKRQTSRPGGVSAPERRVRFRTRQFACSPKNGLGRTPELQARAPAVPRADGPSLRVCVADKKRAQSQELGFTRLYRLPAPEFRIQN
jgi:hypothetical protein